MIKLGYAICGSFCTIENSVKEIKRLSKLNYDIYPILSPIVCSTDTRFGKAEDLINTLEQITGKKIINKIEEAEPVGPKRMFDVLAVCPCTSNTMAKLAYGITDTSVTMAVKSHIRNDRPVVIALATNDALGSSAKNIGMLLNQKNIYFVPFSQDDSVNKKRSMIADFSLLDDTIKAALNGQQITPIIK